MRDFDAEAGTEVEYYRVEATFDVVLVPSSDASIGWHQVVLFVDYQLCDDTICLRPETRQLHANVEVKDAAFAAAGHGHMHPVVPQEPQSSMDRYMALNRRRLSEHETEIAVRAILADDPQFARGYGHLSHARVERGDERGADVILQEGLAAGADAANLSYSLAQVPTDLQLFESRLHDYVRRFPRAHETPFAYSSLGHIASSHSQRVRWYRLAAKTGSAEHFSGLLAPFEAEKAPAKALALAGAALSALPANYPEQILEGYRRRVEFYRSICEIDKHLKEGSSSNALQLSETLEAVDLNGNVAKAIDRALVRRVKTRVLLAAKKTEEAYQELLNDSTTLTEPRLKNIAVKLGKELKRSSRQVNSELWQRLLSRDFPVAAFEVPDGSRSMLRASDFRGRILVVNAWNPGCPGCRRELPYMEQLRKKYEGTDIGILVINVYSQSKEKASELVRRHGWGFRFLHATDESWDSGLGQGQTFLIDQQGRVLFNLPLYGPLDMKIADGLIAGLVRHGTKESEK